ncbi:MAG: hypothetical protein NW207_02760 [Cytophagales bacterium]|nr:hypothetical protein [Cytophagales bacterium]
MAKYKCFILIFLLLGSTKSYEQVLVSNTKSYTNASKKSDSKLLSSKKTVKKKQGSAGMVAVKKMRPIGINHDKLTTQKSKGSNRGATLFTNIRDIFCVSCRAENKTECPDIDRKSENNFEYDPGASNYSKANLVRSSNSVHFDVIALDDIHLDIPAFKQFKNNMTDFTSDGEHQFQAILQKIGVFLGANYEGKGVTLNIIGSASQIPTSFDPSKPNNNINPDGSSILGKTSIANNKMLAKARADELAKRIMAVFPSINIMTPKLEDIKIGDTKWTKAEQHALSKAYLKGDKEGMMQVYEPFQKDQWVKVESKERASKTIQPESIKMYMVSTIPHLKYEINGVENTVKSVFIVSKNTYDRIGDNFTFATVQARDEFLDKMNLKIHYEKKNNIIRWYLLNGEEEINAFKIQDYETKVYTLYQMGIVDNLDENILEQHIIAEVMSKHQK